MTFKSASLPPAVLQVVRDKGTEAPFSGQYNDFGEPGTYLCRLCGLALFRAHAKFHASCGWPSFDEEILGCVKHVPDQDGRRMEILCHRCGAHLGHVFAGEGLTPKNTRYCVNSLSLDFTPNQTILDTAEAIFAGGCFWGVESLFLALPHVLKTEVGYTGGDYPNPTYEAVCRGTTKHYEAVRVLYDPSMLAYEALVKYFFEIHHPEQPDRQGNDRGWQYKSAIFYNTDTEKKIAEAIIASLVEKGIQACTQLLPTTIFWRAEEEHQQYHRKHPHTPICHVYTKKF